MQRGDTRATRYSWFNGFRVCDDHYRQGTRHEYDAIIQHDAIVGPCDRPVDGKGAMSYSKRVA